MAEIFTVEQRGIGKPDYSKYVSSGQTRAGISLKYNQTFKQFAIVFSAIITPYVWVLPPLAIGASASLIDMETGLPTPFTVPKGYILSLIAKYWSYREDVDHLLYIDGDFGTGIGLCPSGEVQFINELRAVSTEVLDPIPGATAHLWDIIVENLGGGVAVGGCQFQCLLEVVGTSPLPNTKTVRCKWCYHEEVVPRETTKWICPKCGELNIYYNLSSFRGSR